MSPRMFENSAHRLGYLHGSAGMLRSVLGDLSPGDVADALAMAGIQVGRRTGSAAAARDAELRACVDRLEASWAPRRPADVVLPRDLLPETPTNGRGVVVRRSTPSEGRPVCYTVSSAT